jgi:hypothetical protein
MRHRLVIATALLLALVGCSDDSPGPKASAGTTPATASPSPTATAPAMPSTASASTFKGSEAFARHWFATVSYAIQTGDTRALKQLAAPECLACSELDKAIHHIYDNGARNEGGSWTVRRIAADGNIKLPYRRMAVEIQQARQHLVAANGTQIDNDPPKRFELWVTLVRRNGAWLVYEQAKP